MISVVILVFMGCASMVWFAVLLCCTAVLVRAENAVTKLLTYREREREIREKYKEKEMILFLFLLLL